MKDSPTIIRASLPLAVKFAPQAGAVEGYASTFGGEPDAYGDIIAPGAFKRSLEDLRQRGEAPAMLWAHDPSAPIGRWTDLVEDARGLRVRGVLNLESERGLQAHAHLKAGDVTGLSIGYRSAPGTVEYHQDGTQTLHELDLREISVVTLPANRAARITSVKSLASQRELQSLLHETGLPRGAAAKIAAAGWQALIGEEDQPDLNSLGARIKAATAEIIRTKG